MVDSAITSLIGSYGYVILFLLVGLESLGIPLPGETALIAAAAIAASGHISIYAVVATAAVAAILGDNGGYWIGRKGGLELARRYGHFVRLDEAKIGRAHDFFQKHGAKTVFIGRFIALLRTWAAVLAGVAGNGNCPEWPRRTGRTHLSGARWQQSLRCASSSWRFEATR